MKRTRIYCPQCRWQPRAEDRWQCTPRCGTVWNTFWTGGVCPGCAQRWHDTQCLACGAFSAHRRWYHEHDPAEPARTRVPQEAQS